MKVFLLIVSFAAGVVTGCLFWNDFGAKIVKHLDNDTLTPNEEVNRMMDCLGIGD